MATGRNYIKRGIRYFKKNGLAKTGIKAIERIRNDIDEKDYVPFHACEADLAKQRAHVFEHPYMISIIVPVYETDPALLRKMLDSVGDQTYGNWEIVLADASSDDSRRNVVLDFIEEYNLMCSDRFGNLHEKISYVHIGANKGISGNSNEALFRAKGDYIGLLDHDDILENTALFDIMSEIESFENNSRNSDEIKKVMAVYTDEDKISADGTVYFDPHYKPDYDPVLLCTNNYICHFFAAEAELMKGTGGFRSEYDGAQDHDLILRCLEGVRRECILHVPKVLYHWRSTANSTAENPDSKLYAYEAGKRAAQEHFKREGIGAKLSDSPHLGFFEIKYDTLHRSVDSITPEKWRKIKENEEQLPDSEFILILSSDLTPLDADYIKDMMSCMNLPYVGAVTGKIIGRGGKVESAGFDIDENGAPVPRFAGLGRNFSGYKHRANLDQLVSAYSPDCVLLRKEAIAASDGSMALKDGYDIYYKPEAVFKRKAK